MTQEVKTAIEETKVVLDLERPCSACVFSNDECNWCHENKIPITRYMRGCKKYMTNEQALRKTAEEEYARHQKQLQRIMLKMDVMAYLINGASIELEKVEKELDDSYNAMRNKDDKTIRDNKERKRNRERLHKAYKSMKFSMQDIRNTFDTYVEHYFATIFTEDDGQFNFKESDKNLVNSGVVTSFVNVLVDKTLDNGDNAKAIMDFMMSLKGADIFTERDYSECMIRK